MARNRETTTEARERQARLIQTEGVDAAIEALIATCRDPKAPAPAKSSAGTALLRAGGWFNPRDPEEDLKPSEMTSEQLQRAIERLRRDSEEIDRKLAGDGEEEGASEDPGDENNVFS